MKSERKPLISYVIPSCP